MEENESTKQWVQNKIPEEKNEHANQDARAS